MKTEILDDTASIVARAVAEAAAAIRAALAARGEARIVAATGKSQIALLAALAAAPAIDWARVTVFHLDEFVGIAETHPASFRRFLQERFLDRLPVRAAFVPIRGDADGLAGEIARLDAAIGAGPIDLGLAGIGENGHLAFNDPPADFAAADPYILVTLAEATRRQQLWLDGFSALEQVPTRAISMSIRQIMRSRRLLVVAPEARKAKAVRDALEGPLTPDCPASILREHPACTLFLDRASASLLRGGSP